MCINSFSALLYRVAALMFEFFFLIQEKKISKYEYLWQHIQVDNTLYYFKSSGFHYHINTIDHIIIIMLHTPCHNIYIHTVCSDLRILYCTSLLQSSFPFQTLKTVFLTENIKMENVMPHLSVSFVPNNYSHYTCCEIWTYTVYSCYLLYIIIYCKHDYYTVYYTV